MKILHWIILVSVVLTVSCARENDKIPTGVVNIPNSASGESNTGQLPAITFDKVEHDFGKVIQGEIVSYSFKFKNTGGSDLVIANISTSCGCTASSYPKEPVKPGAEEKIEVSFNSSGRQGFQNKTLTVAANTQPSTTELMVKAMVIIPEKE